MKSSTEKKILVVGATGMLGEPVARRLKDDGFRVRIMLRDVGKARSIFDESFEIVPGDVADIESLARALDGCFGVHVNLSGEIERVGVENVAAAASGKALERITYISGTSVFEENAWFPLARRKLLAQRALEDCKTPHTIFSPAWFMETLPNLVKGGRAFVFGRQPNPYHWVAAEDYARMVSASYMLEEAANKRFFIHGPEGVAIHEALRRYCAVFHPQITRVATLPFWLARVISSVRGSEEMRSAVDFMAFFEKVGEGGDPAEANRLLGAPAITLEEWLGRRAPSNGPFDPVAPTGDYR